MSRGSNLQALIVFSLLLFIFHSVASSFKPTAATPAKSSAHSSQYNSSQLDLSHGLNLSIFSSYNDSTGNPKDSEGLLFKLGVPTVDAGGIFFPILSSPLFNRSHPSQNTGFSLGFYFLPVAYNPLQYPQQPCANNGCHIYMAVCAGSSGYSSRSLTGYNLYQSATDNILLTGATDANDPNMVIIPYQSVDGFVVPVWIANMGRPIKYANRASLVAEHSEGSSSMELQLRDGDEVVWSVSNVGMMEIQDTGELLIYNSPSRTEVIWPISSSNDYATDTLVNGQTLTEGMELRSNDSSYLARVEMGGLVFYLNKVSFNMQAQPPYWIFPVPRRLSNKSDNISYINQLVYSAPCSGSSAYLSISLALNQYILSSIFLSDSKSCASYNSTYSFQTSIPAADNPWGFLRLENDGRLYIYVVAIPIYTSAYIATRLALDYIDLSGISNGSNDFNIYGQSWGQCDVPMACGPFGMCTPGGTTICSCQNLSDSFEQVNLTDISQGCQPRTALPNCIAGTEHINTTDFVAVASTASIFLFNRWNFHSSTNDSVGRCKNSCSSNCSCKGFIYQLKASVCFFITDGITLLHLQASTNLSFLPQYINQVVLATDYVTYLKVVSTPTINKPSTPTINKPSTITINKATVVLIKVVIPALVACLVLACTGYFLTAWKKKRAHMILRAREEEYLRDILPLLPSRFSYKDLHEATRGFSELLGAGGCGSVYAGVLFDGRKVAVKVLKVFLQQGGDQSKQFLAEVASVGRTNHQNIVRLVGFCWEVSERLLVYEYVERGALDRWLFGGDRSADMEAPLLLDWQTRYNVALGIARGLNYLHEECEPPILHFDIKPQNILLDDAFVAKMADFGMSRLMPRDMSSVVTGVRGTPGYIAPEWFSRGSVSKKSDVYSMGMVLLELVGGRRILDTSLLLNKTADSVDTEAFHFPSWAAKKCEKGLLMELVDKRLHAVDCEQAQRLVHIAFSCIHEDPVVRPNVSTVLSWLEGSSPIEVPLSSFALHAGRH